MSVMDSSATAKRAGARATSSSGSGARRHAVSERTSACMRSSNRVGGRPEEIFRTPAKKGRRFVLSRTRACSTLLSLLILHHEEAREHRACDGKSHPMTHASREFFDRVLIRLECCFRSRANVCSLSRFVVFSCLAVLLHLDWPQSVSGVCSTSYTQAHLYAFSTLPPTGSSRSTPRKLSQYFTLLLFFCFNLPSG